MFCLLFSKYEDPSRFPSCVDETCECQEHCHVCPGPGLRRLLSGSSLDSSLNLTPKLKSMHLTSSWDRMTSEDEMWSDSVNAVNPRSDDKDIRRTQTVNLTQVKEQLKQSPEAKKLKPNSVKWSLGLVKQNLKQTKSKVKEGVVQKFKTLTHAIKDNPLQPKKFGEKEKSQEWMKKNRGRMKCRAHKELNYETRKLTPKMDNSDILKESPMQQPVKLCDMEKCLDLMTVNHCGTRHGSNIKLSPKTMKQSPKTLKQSPKAVKLSPKTIKVSPKIMNQSPKTIKQSSNTMKRSPGMLKEGLLRLGEVEKRPGLMTGNADRMKHGPNMKLSSETMKLSHKMKNSNVSKESPMQNNIKFGKMETSADLIKNNDSLKYGPNMKVSPETIKLSPEMLNEGLLRLRSVEKRPELVKVNDGRLKHGSNEKLSSESMKSNTEHCDKLEAGSQRHGEVGMNHPNAYKESLNRLSEMELMKLTTQQNDTMKESPLQNSIKLDSEAMKPRPLQNTVKIPETETNPDSLKLSPDDIMKMSPVEILKLSPGLHMMDMSTEEIMHMSAEDATRGSPEDSKQMSPDTMQLSPKEYGWHQLPKVRGFFV